MKKNNENGTLQMKILAGYLLLILLVCVIQIIFDLAARKADKRTR